jgi:DHA2 family multidrug resistance protein
MFGFFGINVVYPLWLQTVLGYTASWAGLATAPVGILAFLVSPNTSTARVRRRWTTSTA